MLMKQQCFEEAAAFEALGGHVTWSEPKLEENYDDWKRTDPGLSLVTLLTEEKDQRLYSPEFADDRAAGLIRQISLDEPSLEARALVQHTTRTPKGPTHSVSGHRWPRCAVYHGKHG